MFKKKESDYLSVFPASEFLILAIDVFYRWEFFDVDTIPTQKVPNTFEKVFRELVEFACVRMS